MERLTHATRQRCSQAVWQSAKVAKGRGDRAEVVNAVHFASVYHKKWLWDGVRGEDNRVQIASERT